MVIVSRLWPISCRPPGGLGANHKGGEAMVLRLYHIEKEPHNVFNVVKVSIDDHRTVAVTIKHRRTLEYKSYRHEVDYQRLTVQVD